MRVKRAARLQNCTPRFTCAPGRGSAQWGCARPAPRRRAPHATASETPRRRRAAGEAGREDTTAGGTSSARAATAEGTAAAAAASSGADVAMGSHSHNLTTTSNAWRTHLHSVEVQVGRVAARWHRRGCASAHADAVGGAADLYHQHAQVGVVLVEVGVVDLAQAAAAQAQQREHGKHESTQRAEQGCRSWARHAHAHARCGLRHQSYKRPQWAASSSTAPTAPT